MINESSSTNPVFGLERHGFEHIPESDRAMTLRETTFLWVGTNLNLFFVAVGAVAISLGLSLWQALLACVVGNALFALVGWASVGGARAGLPVVTFTRAVFGVQGNRLNAVLAWVASVAFEAINTIFGAYALLALFPLLGWSDPGTPGKLLAVFLRDLGRALDPEPAHDVAADVEPQDLLGFGPASSGSLRGLIPPALPRPPVRTCALTTTWPPSSPAAEQAFASSGVVARRPSETGIPKRANSSLPWYSYRSPPAARLYPRAPCNLVALSCPTPRQGGSMDEQTGQRSPTTRSGATSTGAKSRDEEPDADGTDHDRHRERTATTPTQTQTARTLRK